MTLEDNEYDFDKEFKKELEEITNIRTYGANSTRSRNNIKKTLVAGLRKKYNIKDKEELKRLSDAILGIHGMSDAHFDIMTNFENILNKEINEVSVDDNSNKNEKSARGQIAEAGKPNDKLIGYDYLYRSMKELYGKAEAKRLSMDMYDLSLGLADSSNILLPYCWALDSSKLITCGRDFGQLPSDVSKRIDSYISALQETVHQLSNHLAGALAIGDLFLCLTHLLLKTGTTLEMIRDDIKIRKEIENKLQQLVHSLNHLTRSGGTESPFTNFSVFDRSKLTVLVDEYQWMFSDYDKEMVLEFIIETQDIFLKFFNKGAPLLNGLPYRFPVTTMNFAKTAENKILDEEFLKYVCQLDISRFNIFTSEGTKVCSCCRLISNADLLELASQVNSFGGGGSISLGSHRVVTTNYARIALEADSSEEYFTILEKRLESSAKILKAHKLLLVKLTEKGSHPFIKNGWINMRRMFSTFGIMGIFEANAIMNNKFEISGDFTEDVLRFVNTKVNELSKKYDIIGNIEQIPGESFAARLAQADNLIFNLGEDYYPMYANQFVPLWKDASLYERLSTDGRYNQLITGGGIVHAQIDDGITPQLAEKIIKFAVSCGCEHFALNKVYSICKKCKDMTPHRVENCPKCNGEVEYVTRAIGYLSPVKDWNIVRKNWEFEKRTFVDLKSIEMEINNAA